MKKLLALLPLALLGCTHIAVEREVTGTGTNISFHATSLFSNTTLKGLGVDGSTKTTASLLKLTTDTTEPNAQSITATGSALGELIGTAAAATAKGTVKP